MFANWVPACLENRHSMHVLALLLVLALNSTVFVRDLSSSDARVLEKLQLNQTTDLLFLSREEKLAAFRNIDRIMPTRALETGPYVYPLGSQPRDFSNVTYTLDG